MSGQIDEVSSIAKAARSAAKAAQDTGDQANVAAKDAARQGIDAANAAGATARAANDRISALDDFDVKSATTVLFALDSSTLSKDAQAQLDGLAETAKNEKGYMLEITGFASSDGDPAVNERLSQRRADAVVRYSDGESSDSPAPPGDSLWIRRQESGGRQCHPRRPKTEPPRRSQAPGKQSSGDADRQIAAIRFYPPA